MLVYITANEMIVRLGCFLGIFVLVAVWEVIAPRRSLTISKVVRWGNNLTLMAINTILLRLLFPAAAVGVANFAASQSWGVLNLLQVPPWLSIICSVIALDFVMWLQHVMMHAVPIFWRVHRVHHADPDLDLTTGARFHPIEIMLSMFIKFAAIVVLGPPIIAVIVFEVMLNGLAMFNHGNVRLPRQVDRVLRWLIVTPDMHRVHHSVEEDEANSNFGFNLCLWDRLLGSYRNQPRQGHEGMAIGIHGNRLAREVSWLPGMLTLPFRGSVTRYAINRRQWTCRETADE